MANVQGQLYFSYNGAAVIFNDTRGARFAGYFRHPRSNESCYVTAPENWTAVSERVNDQL
jgi:hypothetical protein